MVRAGKIYTNYENEADKKCLSSFYPFYDIIHKINEKMSFLIAHKAASINKFYCESFRYISVNYAVQLAHVFNVHIPLFTYFHLCFQRFKYIIR